MKMPTPQQWASELGKDRAWQSAYGFVATVVRQYTATVRKPMTSTQLVQELFPIEYARDDGAVAARRRIFKALRTLAHGVLKDHVTRGVPAMVYGHMASSYVWQTPEPAMQEATTEECDDF